MNRQPESRSNTLCASWEQNARLWTAAVRESTIARRAAGTDQAIVDAVLRCAPRSIIDIGCGEGWLVRRLSQEHSCRAVGIDGSAALIDHARGADPNNQIRCSDLRSPKRFTGMREWTIRRRDLQFRVAR